MAISNNMPIVLLEHHADAQNGIKHLPIDLNFSPLDENHRA
jgi:hypothetical protein